MKVKNIDFKIILVLMLTIIFIGYAHGKIAYGIPFTIKNHNPSKVIYIKSIKDIKKTVSRNVTFGLPIHDLINAEFSDGSYKKVSIVWSVGESKYNKTGLYCNTYFGAIKGYNRKVKLTVMFK